MTIFFFQCIKEWLNESMDVWVNELAMEGRKERRKEDRREKLC